MPRNGSGVYSLPPGSTFSPNTLIQSSVVNGINTDLATDLNTPRPIVAGGTGATTAAAAAAALAVLPTAGGTMTGDLNMGGKNVLALAALNGGPLSSTRNKIINGDFDLWQRATTQSTSGYGSDDRWNNENVGSTKTASQQTFALGQTLVLGNPKFFSRTVVTSSAGAGNYVRKTQRIEGVRTLSGKTITLTFYGSSDASRNIAVEFVQNFGTGGSPSSAVTGIGSQLVALTTTAAKKSVTVAIPSISGKTLGSNGNDYLELVLWYDAGSTFSGRAASLGQQSGQFDIAHVSVAEGDATSETDPFSPRPLQQELGLCQRYFQLHQAQIIYGYNAAANNILNSWLFPVQMRGIPSVGYSNITYSNCTAASLGTLAVKPDQLQSLAAITALGAGSTTFDVALDAEL